jgi:tetratricopeptide (TPR) repeat protein
MIISTIKSLVSICPSGYSTGDSHRRLCAVYTPPAECCGATYRSQRCVSVLVLFILVMCSVPVFSAPQLPEDMHAMAMASVDYVYKEKFKLAEEEAKKIIKKYPDHPAGYFFYAAALESWMGYYESDKREEEFYRFCDLAIEKAENAVGKDQNNAWALFFLGGADGAKGTYESRYEKWITSFRHGWKGVSTLQSLYKKSPDIKDTYYGLGMYDYWRSSLTKLLWWMPGIENRTDQGIRELMVAKTDGVYTCVSASADLVAILNNEKRYGEALTIAEEMLARFPGSLVFCRGRAAALFGLGRFDESEAVYRFILERVEAEPVDNHYNAVICHFWLARIYSKLKRHTLSIAECNRMGYYNLDGDIKKRLDKYFSEAARLKDQAQAANIKNPETEVVP